MSQRKVTKHSLIHALSHCHTMVEVADFLGVNRQNIYRICRHYGIDFKSYLKPRATKSVKQTSQVTKSVKSPDKPINADNVSTSVSTSTSPSVQISDYTGRKLGDVG